MRRAKPFQGRCPFVEISIQRAQTILSDMIRLLKASSIFRYTGVTAASRTIVCRKSDIANLVYRSIKRSSSGTGR